MNLRENLAFCGKIWGFCGKIRYEYAKQDFYAALRKHNDLAN
jgi:hypothetical protein